MEQTKPKTTRKRRSKPKPSLPLVDVYVQPVRPALKKRRSVSPLVWIIKFLILVVLFVALVWIAAGYLTSPKLTEYINPVTEINGRPITVK